MKLVVSMKNPDALSDAVAEAVSADVAKLGLSQEEAEAVEEIRASDVRNACQKWFRYGEYLDVEIDTEAGTCTVLPAHR